MTRNINRLTETQIASLIPFNINGVTIHTLNQYEHRLGDKGHLYNVCHMLDKELLTFVTSKGYKVANYYLKSDYESGAWSDWALLDSNNNIVLDGSGDYAQTAYTKIKALAQRELGFDSDNKQS